MEPNNDTILFTVKTYDLYENTYQVEVPFDLAATMTAEELADYVYKKKWDGHLDTKFHSEGNKSAVIEIETTDEARNQKLLASLLALLEEDES